MNRTEFIVVTAAILFVAFLLGWFAPLARLPADPGDAFGHGRARQDGPGTARGRGDPGSRDHLPGAARGGTDEPAPPGRGGTESRDGRVARRPPGTGSARPSAPRGQAPPPAPPPRGAWRPRKALPPIPDPQYPRRGPPEAPRAPPPAPAAPPPPPPPRPPAPRPRPPPPCSPGGAGRDLR